MKLKEAISGNFVRLQVVNKENFFETHVIDNRNEVIVIYPFYVDALKMMIENDAVQEEFLINSDGDITAILL